MAEELVTIKTSVKAHRAIKMIAAQRGMKQYEVMEALIEVANLSPELFVEAIARRATK